MSDKMVVGSITFSNIANPNTWNIGEPKALVFSCPSEAKRGEELFKAAQDAAFKAGREQGMREAAGIADPDKVPRGIFAPMETYRAAFIRDAILAAIGEGDD